MAVKMNPRDLDRIAEAVAKAETTTAGEIFCVLAPEVSDYRETPLVWAAAAALVLPAGALFAGLRPEMLTRLFGGWGVGHHAALDGAILSALSTYIIVQAVVFVLAALLVSLPPIRRALTPASLKAARVRRAAMEQFLSRGLHVTRDRTGVLIFAALAERRVEVIADEGIYKAAPDTVWDTVVADLVDGLKRGRIADGFVAAVGRAGAILAAHVPPRPDNRNELPDGLTILPKR
ncbi:TPM domain-containing protein [uncultured Caulobacter sp.]|uniref:TPM domain-containing protein n=1 Tax=uncultured Caulobacter sp. TaxID=158749 RepID=UPI00262DEAB5|nr:TPM domain-containing protein [uncultured Caulobacter sp.]